jgi:hypothetical protein
MDTTTPIPIDDRNQATLESAFRKRSPFASWQMVEVLFPASANTDVDIRHTLTPTTPNQLGWLIVRSSGAGVVYRGFGSTWGVGYIRLRSSLASHRATLLLFTPLTDFVPPVLDA